MPVRRSPIVERTRPRILVIDVAIEDKIAQVRDRMVSVEKLIVVGRGSAGDFEAAISGFPDTDPGVDIDPDDPVAMTFTGGTTGEPKGAVVSHNARYVSAWTTAIEHRVTGEDVTGIVTPMFHAVGLMIWYQSTIWGMYVGDVPQDVADFIDRTEEHGISSVFMVPVQVRDLIDAPNSTPAACSR